MSIVVDMVKAREIWRNQIRRVRESELNKLDVEFQRALEQGKDTKAIVAKKQALRDLTDDPAIDAAKTPEDLYKIWPSILPLPQRQ